ncbi:MAG: DUF1552 domain-containing protein [Planctomycetota bacterium]
MNKRSNRRLVLQSLAGSLALPALPSLASDAIKSTAAHRAAKATKFGTRRFVAVGNLLGFQTEKLFPETTGREFESTELLEPLQENRDKLTVYRGLDHGIRGGHFAVHTFLSGVLHHEAKNRPNGNVTIDQFIADEVGVQTRFPSLTVGSEGGIHGGCQMAWTKSGVRVPPITGPAELFQKLFVGETRAEREASKRANSLQASILDSIHDEAQSLTRRINREDRDKLDEYFTSIRDVERRLAARKKWVDQPKPEARFDPPADTNTVEDLPMLYELIALALQTDSTRVATLEIGGSFLPQHLGIEHTYHSLSHHGNDQESIDHLVKLECYQLEQFSTFISRLASMEDGEQSLLDSTALLFGSGMGDGNHHKNSDLPIIMAGGGYGGAGFKNVSREVTGAKTPLCNLLLDVAQRMGVDADSFGTSTGTFA